MRRGALPTAALSLAAALLLAACQGPPPPAPEPGKTSRLGETTIVTSGSVRVDSVYAR